jgi:hypothetical protein
LLSGEIDGSHGTTFASEYGWGSTGMGFRGRPWVQLTYYAAYALVSQTFGRNRISARFDVFGTQDRDHSPVAEVNTESGRAWAIAYFYSLTPRMRLGGEFTNIVNDRVAVPDTNGRMVTLEARYRF